jgi:hypothetical protein
MTLRAGEIRRAADAMAWAREHVELLRAEWARLNKRLGNE